MSPKNVLSRRRCVVGHSVEATTEGGGAGGDGGGGVIVDKQRKGRDRMDRVTGG